MCTLGDDHRHDCVRNVAQHSIRRPCSRGFDIPGSESGPAGSVGCGTPKLDAHPAPARALSTTPSPPHVPERTRIQQAVAEDDVAGGVNPATSPPAPCRRQPANAHARPPLPAGGKGAQPPHAASIQFTAPAGKVVNPPLPTSGSMFSFPPKGTAIQPQPRTRPWPKTSWTRRHTSFCISAPRSSRCTAARVDTAGR